MGNIASTILLACAIPFNMVALFTNMITTLIVKSQRCVLGVPSTIQLETEDFVKHFSLWVDSCVTISGNTPKSLIHTVDNQRILIGFSCRSLFETGLTALKASPYFISKRDKSSSLKIVTTPIHHKSYVAIMEKMTDSIEVLSLTDNMTAIVLDHHAEEMIKTCDVIVVTHLFGQSFDLTELIALKNRYQKILIVDGVMAGARNATHTTLGIDLDIYSTGQDKRPVAVGGGYCIPRHEAFAEMEAETLSYPVVGRLERLKKILNTFFLRVLYQHRPFHLFLLAAMKLFHIKLSNVTGVVRKSNPGFQHDGYLLCPNESMVQSVKLELPNVLQMEDKYIACWKEYLTLLPNEAREAFYPFYHLDKPVIMPYNQILIPVGHEEKFLAFCDTHLIGCLGNQNYKALASAGKEYHMFNARIMNFITVIRPLDEMQFVTERVAEYFQQQQC